MSFFLTTEEKKYTMKAQDSPTLASRPGCLLVLNCLAGHVALSQLSPACSSLQQLAADYLDYQDLPVLEPQLSLTVCLVGLQMDTLSDSIFGSMCASVVVAFSTDSAFVGQPGTEKKNQMAAPGAEEKKSRFAPLVAGLAGECFLACCSQLPHLPAWTAALRAAG